MTSRHLEDYDDIWAEMLEEAEQPDAGWPWDYKLQQAQQEARFEAYVIEVEDLVHGLLYLETQWHRSGLPQHYPLVYVQALTVAPWNRKELEDPPYLRGVGTMLLTFARERSQQLGYQGRIGLHSIPEAEGFYHRVGMPSYGPDPEKEGLIYFEYGAVMPNVAKGGIGLG